MENQRKVMYNPPHPGEIIKEDILPAKGLSLIEAAEQLSISPLELNNVMDGNIGISSYLAVKLEEWGCSSAEVWMGMQADYDIWQIKHPFLSEGKTTNPPHQTLGREKANCFTEILMSEPKEMPDGSAQWRTYEVVEAETYEGDFARIHFQQGSPKEVGVNGVYVEDVLNIAMHRLKSYQKSQMACDENQYAINAIDKALLCLDQRTRQRQHRGVEGKFEA